MPTLIVLIGPTGVGKTELSLRLAETFQTSIVSADSRQLYAELKIGTAAPTPDQLKRVPHQLVGTLHLTDYSAAQYETEALEILEKLFTQHEVVILTGGSMMYVDAICKGIDDIPTVDAETRQLMLQKYEEEGLEQLLRRTSLVRSGILPDCRPKESQAGDSCVGDLLYDRTHLYFFSHPTKKNSVLSVFP